jgi:uncharacterized membrane protein
VYDRDMSELVVVGFKKDISRAALVLGQLRERDEAWTANLHGAIALYRGADGKLQIDQSFESTKGSSVINDSLIGTLVGLAVAALALPLTGGMSGVAFGSFAAGALGGAVIGAHHGREAAWWKEDLGISASFLDQVNALVAQGDSAIFILLRAKDETDFVARFQAYDGTVLRTTLTPEQAEKLHARIAK